MRRLGRFADKYKYLVLAVWVAAIVTLAVFAFKLPSVLSGNGFEYDGKYNETRDILEKDFGQPESTIILLFEKDKGVTDENWHSYIEETFTRLEKYKPASGLISPFNLDGMMKGKYAYGVITFDRDAGSLADEIRELEPYLKDKKGLSVSMTGEPVIVRDLNEASQKDLARAEMIGLPIALIVLVLAFGGLVAASVPLIIGIVSILMTMGIVYFFSHTTNLSIFILNIVPMIGLALSIDFALLIINRYKEELQTKSVAESIEVTVATAGRSIVFSAFCVFIGLSGLLFIQIDIFQNVALGGMIVVFVSALCAITFLPAFLSLLGERINKFTVIKPRNKTKSGWHSFAKTVMKHPVIMMLAAFSILLAGIIPAKDMHLTIPGTDSLPKKYESRVAYETFRKEFQPEGKRDYQKITVVLESDSRMDEEKNLDTASEAIAKFENSKSVDSIESFFTAVGIANGKEYSQLKMVSAEDPSRQALLSKVKEHYIKGDKMLVNVYLKTGEHSDKAREWVRDWSEKDYGMKAYFGGQIKFQQEIFDEIYKKAPYGLILIFISTFIILMLAFRSVLIPIKAILMNMLSLGATFGIVVYIFQEGHFGADPADIALILPVFVFSLVFGLSMDYEVFLISRIQEYYLETGDNSKATILGLTTTSKIITSAAAIMIVVTGAFAFTGVMPVKQLGVGIAIAIFIDATLIRMVLVPSLMKLLGDWNWWFFGKGRKKAALGDRE
ncbi:MMPL family transporter [Bacillus sp. FJAT-27445]|uniref:MMPL family transporter n=1 Tax=Bacillus sp. FJAT-27445 TaxID=1679166 RepID=UPI000743D12D|nr:MMPL family transporter [Bacillus sp. FJAT-27445]